MKITGLKIMRMSIVLTYIIGAVLLGLYVATGNSKILLLAGLFILLSMCLNKLENHINKIKIKELSYRRVTIVCICGILAGAIIKYAFLGFVIPIRILLSIILIVFALIFSR